MVAMKPARTTFFFFWGPASKGWRWPTSETLAWHSWSPGFNHEYHENVKKERVWYMWSKTISALKSIIIDMACVWGLEKKHDLVSFDVTSGQKFKVFDSMLMPWKVRYSSNSLCRFGFLLEWENSGDCRSISCKCKNRKGHLSGSPTKSQLREDTSNC